MAFSALCNAHAMRTNLSMTITRMVAINSILNKTTAQSPSAYPAGVCPIEFESDDDEFEENSITQSASDVYSFIATNGMHNFQWSQEMQGIILSSFYWGYVLAHLPGGLLAQKYGGKYILAFGIFFSGVLSLLIPVCVDYGGAHSLIAIRMLMGICQGPIIPACMNLFSTWIPLRERCTMLSLVQSGISVRKPYHRSSTSQIWNVAGKSNHFATFQVWISCIMYIYLKWIIVSRSASLPEH